MARLAGTSRLGQHLLIDKAGTPLLTSIACLTLVASLSALGGSFEMEKLAKSSQ